MIMNLPAAYQILDLPIGSSLEVVQVRYRQLVKKYHPDRFSNAQDKAIAEEHLKRINEAKEVIQKHWFDAKIKASDSIPYGPKESAKPKEQPQAPPQSSPKAPSQSSPKTPPQPQLWWQQILQLLLVELQELFKKIEKKALLDDALEQLDKPFKFSSETKLRRAWYAVAIIIIVDLVYIGYCENMERRNANSLEPQTQAYTQVQAHPQVQAHTQVQTYTQGQTNTQAQTRYLRGLTPVSEVTYQSQTQQEKQKELVAQMEKQQRLETAIYFKRLELDAAERAIRKDSELIDEIEIKLYSEDMANESRRNLEHMKVFRDQDKKQKEIERASILEELSQLVLSQQQPLAASS